MITRLSLRDRRRWSGGETAGEQRGDLGEDHLGLVADLTSTEALAERAIAGAEQIAAQSPWGVRLTKQGMWSALEIPSERTAIEYEDRQQIMATFGRAVPEAIGAFLEKRPPQFAD